MAKHRKKIEALAELYESERDYIKDIHLWKLLLHDILGLGKIRLKGSYPVIVNLIKNVENIERTSLNLLNSMIAKNNKILEIESTRKMTENDCLNLPKFPKELKNMTKPDFEYYSNFEYLLNNYEYYIKYIQNLPQVEREFETFLDTDRQFLNLVNSHLAKQGSGNLGIRNYLFRPTGKIVRYSNLIKAVIKNEENELMKEKYEELVRKLVVISKSLDVEFKKRSELFQTFDLSTRFIYSSTVQEKYSLGLIYKKTKLLKEGKLIVKLGPLIPSSYKQVFIFNRLILFCLTNDKPYGNLFIEAEPLFLSKQYILKEYEEFFGDEDLMNLYPLFLVEKSNFSVRALYFEDESTRDVYFNIIDQAIQLVRSEMGTNISIREVKKFDEDLCCLCFGESSIGSFLCSSINREHNCFIDNQKKDDQVEAGNPNEESKLTISSYDMNETMETFSSNDKNEATSSLKMNTDKKANGINNTGSSPNYTNRSKPSTPNFNNSNTGDDRKANRDIQKNNLTNETGKLNSIEYFKTHNEHWSKAEENNLTEKNANDKRNKNVDSKKTINISSSKHNKESESSISELINEYSNGYLSTSNLSESKRLSDREDIESLDSESENYFDFNNFGREESNSNFIYTPSHTTFEDVFNELTIDLNKNAFKLTKEKSLQVEKERGFCFNLCRSGSIPLTNTTVKNRILHERYILNQNLRFFSSTQGIFSVYEDRIKRINDTPATKIFYDPEFEILIALFGDSIQISKFHHESDKYEPNILNIEATNFFFGKSSDTAYLAIVSQEEFAVSVIHLLKVEYNNDEVSINVLRKLYVGFSIFNIFFLKGRIIISCRDFEIIEIDTLKTQELLEVYDSTLSLLLEAKDYFEARTIIKLERNSFLLCFNGGGYLVDKSGMYKEENVNYDWEMLGEEFKAYKRHIIVLGKYYVSVFEIETGKMVLCEYMPGMKMLDGCEEPLIYNKRVLYEIDFESNIQGTINNKVRTFGNKRLDVENKSGSSIYENLLNMSISTLSSKDNFNEWDSAILEYSKEGIKVGDKNEMSFIEDRSSTESTIQILEEKNENKDSEVSLKSLNIDHSTRENETIGKICRLGSKSNIESESSYSERTIRKPIVSEKCLFMEEDASEESIRLVTESQESAFKEENSDIFIFQKDSTNSEDTAKDKSYIYNRYDHCNSYVISSFSNFKDISESSDNRDYTHNRYNSFNSYNINRQECNKLKENLTISSDISQDRANSDSHEGGNSSQLISLETISNSTESKNKSNKAKIMPSNKILSFRKFRIKRMAEVSKKKKSIWLDRLSKNSSQDSDQEMDVINTYSN